jgi:hypothetical protein
MDQSDLTSPSSRREPALLSASLASRVDNRHVAVVAEHVLRRAQAALDGNDLNEVAVRNGAHNGWTDHAKGADALFELGHFVGIEILARILPLHDPGDR